MGKERYRISGVLILAWVVGLVLVLNMGNNFIKLIFALDENKSSGKVAQSQGPRSQLLADLSKQGGGSAIGAAQKFLALNPGDVDVLNQLAEVYINKNNLSAAEETIKKAIAVKPNNSASSKLLAKLYTIKAATDPASCALALEQISKALVANPNDIALLIYRVKVYSNQHDIKKANEAIDIAINLSPNSNKSELVLMKEMMNKPAPEKPKINK